MSTQRYISTSFWDDEWIHALDIDEKMLYMYLLTNPLTNIAGVYKIMNTRIAFDTGIEPHRIELILRHFEKDGKAYRMDEYVVIPSWPKHQKWEKSAKIKEGIINCLVELDIEKLTMLVCINYKFDMHVVFDTLG